MEPVIKERYSPDFLSEACRAFEVAEKGLKTLEGFESYVHEGLRGEDKVVLRLSHSLHRTPEHIFAEMDFIDYLHERGANVSLPLRTDRGELIHTIEDGQGGTFIASLFSFAPGKAPDRKNWSEPFLEAYGQALGKMHRLTKDFVPSRPDCRRPFWDDPVMLDVPAWLDHEDGDLLKAYDRLRAETDALPRDRENFGLLHFDAHSGNYFVTEDNHITLFDFDDSCYGWFVQDLAIVLWHARSLKETHHASWDAVIPAFSRGYARENLFNPEWFRWVPVFMQLRDIDIYAVIKRSFDGWDDDEHMVKFMERVPRQIREGWQESYDFSRGWELA